MQTDSHPQWPIALPPHDVTKTPLSPKKKPREEKGHTTERGREGRRRAVLAVNSARSHHDRKGEARTLSSKLKYCGRSSVECAVSNSPEGEPQKSIPYCRAKTPSAFEFIHHTSSQKDQHPKTTRWGKDVLDFPSFIPVVGTLLRAPEPPDLPPCKPPLLFPLSRVPLSTFR
jgi:hypothetical protein